MEKGLNKCGGKGCWQNSFMRKWGILELLQWNKLK